MKQSLPFYHKTGIVWSYCTWKPLMMMFALHLKGLPELKMAKIEDKAKERGRCGTMHCNLSKVINWNLQLASCLCLFLSVPSFLPISPHCLNTHAERGFEERERTGRVWRAMCSLLKTYQEKWHCPNAITVQKEKVCFYFAISQWME